MKAEAVARVIWRGFFLTGSFYFEKFMRENHPDLASEADLYIEQIESGSIVADLLPWAPIALRAMYGFMEQALDHERGGSPDVDVGDHWGI